jgi:plastocyanin
MIRTKNSFAKAALLLTVLSAACSEHSATAPAPDDGAGDVYEVLISNFAFAAPTITINRGDIVRWRNSTGSFHTVTPNGHEAFAAKQINAEGQTIQATFNTPGRYEYYCEPHRALGMTGVIVVQ